MTSGNSGLPGVATRPEEYERGAILSGPEAEARAPDTKDSRLLAGRSFQIVLCHQPRRSVAGDILAPPRRESRHEDDFLAVLHEHVGYEHLIAAALRRPAGHAHVITR